MSWKLAELRWRQELGLNEHRSRTKSISLEIEIEVPLRRKEDACYREDKHASFSEQQSMHTPNTPVPGLGNQLPCPDIPAGNASRSLPPGSDSYQHKILSQVFSPCETSSSVPGRPASSYSCSRGALLSGNQSSHRQPNLLPLDQDQVDLCANRISSTTPSLQIEGSQGKRSLITMLLNLLNRVADNFFAAVPLLCKPPLRVATPTLDDIDRFLANTDSGKYSEQIQRLWLTADMLQVSLLQKRLIRTYFIHHPQVCSR